MPIANASQHQPGRKVNEADHRPEFHAQSHPPGTAPASNSYTPDVYEPNQANNPDVLRGHGKEDAYTAAGDTLRGATSGDVNTGFGKPLQGETRVEMRHDGEHGRKKNTTGLEGVGAFRPDRTVEHQFAEQRGLEKEEAVSSGTRGNKGERTAADLRPEPAESADSEWKYEPSTKRGKSHLK